MASSNENPFCFTTWLFAPAIELKKITLDRWSKKIQVDLPDSVNNIDELEKIIQSSPKKLKNHNKVLRSLRHAYNINKKSTREIKEETQKIVWKGKRIDSIYTKKVTRITEYVLDESDADEKKHKGSENLKTVLELINKILSILSSLSTLLRNVPKTTLTKSLQQISLPLIS